MFTPMSAARNLMDCLSGKTALRRDIRTRTLAHTATIVSMSEIIDTYRLELSLVTVERDRWQEACEYFAPDNTSSDADGGDQPSDEALKVCQFWLATT